MHVLDAAVAAIVFAVQLAVPQESVSFPTEDGGIVYADVYGTGERGVVLADVRRRRMKCQVAGNIVASSQVGSVEFAADRFGTRLVVVLGHSRCGAVLATLEELERSPESRSPNLPSIVDRIRPSVEPLLETELGQNPDALVHQAVRANIRASANHLRQGSQILEQLIHGDGLLVVGAEYSLETGVVDFFDGLPGTG